MKINRDMNINSLDGAYPARPANKSTKTDTSAASFPELDHLTNTLNNLPDTNPTAVSRAKELINNPDYPSAHVISQLSNFFADKLTSGQT